MLTALLLVLHGPQGFDPGDLSRYSSKDARVSYTQNMGQWDNKAKFRARFAGCDVWVTGTGITYGFEAPKANKSPTGYAVGVEFVGATGKGQPVGIDRQRTISNYYSGKNRANWVKGVPSFGAAMVKDLYPGIDLVSYVDARKKMPRYDLIVHPGADPAIIKMRYTGATNLRVDRDGQLCYDTPLGPVKEMQQVGIQAGPKADFRFFASQELNGDGTVRFNVDGYRKDRTLVIDPIVYSTFVGGSGGDEFRKIAITSDDTSYIGGSTQSSDFPGASGSFTGNEDAVLTAISGDGSSILWATYFGGTDLDLTNCTKADVHGDLYLGGQAYSANLPVTDSTTQQGNSDGFLAKFSGTDGSLIYARYVGGNSDDSVNDLEVDGDQPIVAGDTISTDLPTTAGAFQEHPTAGGDAFVVKYDSTGETVQFLTYLGGNGGDHAYATATADDGTLFVAGSTDSTNFVNGAEGFPFQSLPSGSGDGFALSLSSDGSSVTARTYLGGEQFDQFYSVAVKGTTVVVGGRTFSQDYFTSVGAPQPFSTVPNGTPSGMVTTLPLDLSSVLWSSYYGGTAISGVYSVSFSSSKIIVVGFYSGSGLPVASSQEAIAASGGRDAFVSQIDTELNEIEYTAGLGGDSDDYGFAAAEANDGSIRVVGETASADFPSVSSLQALNGGSDAFLTSIYMAPDTGILNIDSDRGTNPEIAGGVGLGIQVHVNLTNTNGGNVTLTSSDASKLQVGGAASKTINVPHGQDYAEFTVTAVGTVATPTTYDLTATASGGAPQTLSVEIEPFIESVVFQQAAVAGPKRMHAYVSVWEPPATDTNINLSDSSANVTTAPTITVLTGAGQSKGISIYTVPVAVEETVTVTATFGDSSATSAFTLLAPRISAINVDPKKISESDDSNVTVRFASPVAGAQLVHVTSSKSSVISPFDVLVGDGRASGSVDVQPNDISGTQAIKVTLTAHFGSQTVLTTISVVPDAMTKFEVLRKVLAEGNTASYKVTMLGPTSHDRTVNVTSSDPGSFPSFSIIVPNGETTATATFAAPVLRVNATKAFTLTATYGGDVKTGTIRIHPAILSFALSPTSVTGGANSSGVITLYEPLDYNLTITPSTTRPTVAFPGGTFVISSGATSHTFPIGTALVPQTINAKIKINGDFFGKQANLSVTH